MRTTELRERAAALDAADPLAPWRQQFALDDGLVAYFDGNSLGRLPLRTRDALARTVREGWGERLIRGWSEGWVDLPSTVGDEIGAVIGAAPGQTVVTDSTSICLAKALHAAAGLRPDRRRLVIDGSDFPTDRYLARQVAADRGLELDHLQPAPDGSIGAELLDSALDKDVAVVLLSHVDYRTGALRDLGSITEQIHAVGALVIWDLCHSVGVVPIGLDAADADFAVGCTYKYLNAGPGAPAFIHAARRHLSRLTQPLPGWWSSADLFAMSDALEPASDARRLLSGTPNVLGLVAVREGVALTQEADVDAARAKSELLTGYCLDALDTIVERGGELEVVTPRAATERGSQVTVRVADARSLTTRLIEAGVVPDFREPDLVRIGLAPLTTSFEEVHAGLDVLADLLGLG